MNTKNKLLKLIACILVNVVFFIGISFIYEKVFGQVVKVEILAKHDDQNMFSAFYTNKEVPIYNDEMVAKVELPRAVGFRRVKLNLNSKSIEGLKIHFGYKKQVVEVKSLIIKTPFKTLELSAQEIVDTVTEVSPHIKSLEVKDGVLFVNPEDVDAYIAMDKMGEIIDNTPLNTNTLITIVIFTIIASFCAMKFYSYLISNKIAPSKFAFVAIFLLILYAPNMFKLSGKSDGPNTEKGGNASLEYNESLQGVNLLVKKIENYYDNNFGLRNLLIRLNSYIDVKLLKTTSTEKVVMGKDGWLYYGTEGDKNVPDLYRGIIKFTDEELLKIKTNLEERRDYLEAKGIPFILMITPDKESIYPEYYDDRYKKINEETRLDQLLDYLNENSDLHVVDVREELKSKKSIERLYDKTDTHWNEYGAYFGYEVLMNEVNKYLPEIKPKSLDEFDIVKNYKEIGGGDLANMLSLPNEFPEEHILVQPKEERKARDMINTDHNYKLLQGAILDNPDKSLPRLLMFRDSFGVKLIPFVGEHFSHSVYQWDPGFNTTLVEQSNPDIVIHQIVERNLEFLLTDNPKLK